MSKEVKTILIDGTFSIAALLATWLLAPEWADKVGILLGILQGMVLAVIVGPTAGTLISQSIAIRNEDLKYNIMITRMRELEAIDKEAARPMQAPKDYQK